MTINHGPTRTWGAIERLHLVKVPGESLAHVLMKLASWVAFYSPGLEIERHVGQHYKPDVVRLDDDGEPVQWIDCGATRLKKLEVLVQRNKRSLVHIVKPTLSMLSKYRALAADRMPVEGRVRYVTFREGFLNELGDLLRRRTRTHLEATVTEADRADHPWATGDELLPDHLWLVVDGDALDTPVVWLEPT